MITFKKNTYRGAVAVSGLVFCALATLGLVTQVTAGSESVRSSATISADNSFDQAEYRRQVSLIEARADGFDVAERARFERIKESASATSATGLDGFDAAELGRFERLATGR